MNEINDFAEKYAYADVEHALEISPNGNIYNLIGIKGYVGSEIIGKEAMEGVISIHNHVVRIGKNKGDTFSIDDLTYAVRNNTGKQYLVSGERRNAFEFVKMYSEQDIINAWTVSQNQIWEKHLSNNTSPIFIDEEILLNLVIEGFKFYENF